MSNEFLIRICRSSYDQRLRNQALHAKRRRRLAAARRKGTHTNEEWSALKNEFLMHCVRCGCVPGKLVKDHITPLYQGGSDGLENLQPLCIRCNSSKGAEAFNWKEFRRERGF